LRSLSLCTCCRHYPGTATGDIASLISPQSCQPSLIWPSGRPVHRPFRGLLGVHSRYGLHTRAVTVYRDQLSEGFSHFVTSMTAPVASGWSGCRVGLAPTGKRRLCTAHAKGSHYQSYSITSSAVASSVCGNVRPSALAVLRLSTRSNFVGRSRLYQLFCRGRGCPANHQPCGVDDKVRLRLLDVMSAAGRKHLWRRPH